MRLTGSLHPALVTDPRAGGRGEVFKAGLAMRALTVRCFVFLTLVLATPFALVQSSTNSVAVRDASGGLLPGVTVEASSPARFQKTCATVTCGSGTYSILALRPCSYTVKFELPGFTTVIREG